MQLSKISSLALFSIALGACVIDDGNDTDAGTGTATATATDSATATATDSATDTADTSATATDATTGPLDTSGSSESGGTTGGGACGWVASEMFYDCGGDGEDPKGVAPIDCAETPVEGAPCDPIKGPITGVPGCCADASTAAFCLEDGTVSLMPC
jgi:hypothetical protein